MARKPFTKEDVENIFMLRRDGLKYSAIAELMNRPTGTISAFFCLEKKDGRYSKMLNEQSEQKPPEQETAHVEQVRVWPASGVLTEQKAPQPVSASAKELPPREMIKKLYEMGYRIENNKLVCIVKQVVNLNDIINNG